MKNTLNPRVLLVEDDDGLREVNKLVLEHGGFKTLAVSNVRAALEIMSLEHFDALVTDLHMPSEGDGLTVVSAMRHFNPEAVTLILSGYPEMEKAASAILSQADGVLVKPCAPRALHEWLWDRLNKARVLTPAKATAATILEEGTEATITDWLARISNNAHILTVKLEDADRSSHLPQLFTDLVTRLRSPISLGSPAIASPGAADHGQLRRRQGYSASMMVEESRMLQVSIFQTLQNNLFRVNFSMVLESVMVIADEVDAQLAQAMASYVRESKVDDLPTLA